MQQQPVTNQPPVDEQENRVAIVLLHLRAARRSRARRTASRLVRFRRSACSSRVAAPRSIRSSSISAPKTWNTRSRSVCDGRHAQEFFAAVVRVEGLVGVRQAVVRDQRGDMRQFGLLGAQEFLACGHVEEQVAHRDGGAAGAAQLRRNRASCPRRFRRACRSARRRSGFPAPGARRRRSRAAPRRETPASRWRADPLRRAVCWWRGVRRPAGRRRAACRSRCRRSGSVAGRRFRFRRGFSVAPASSEFSRSSLTTEAGRSTTSPAAILLATWSERTRMRPMAQGMRRVTACIHFSRSSRPGTRRWRASWRACRAAAPSLSTGESGRAPCAGPRCG